MGRWGYFGSRVHGPRVRESTMKPVGKPDARNGHVRFDERGWETGRRIASVPAPILDSTPRRLKPALQSSLQQMSPNSRASFARRSAALQDPPFPNLQVAASREFVNTPTHDATPSPTFLTPFAWPANCPLDRHDIQTSRTIRNNSLRRGARHLGPRRMDVGRHRCAEVGPLHSCFT
jgi:hypothetical protein